ncbi:unnamed protein product [Fusarium graminearum]|uniref:Transcription factor domain-containing protein n=1 Tax=Gibberella zeae TaxID=5518 RepID=A0A4E9EEN7_GIBZA|nr:unnamed protein product [Fusarium graminearum]CAG1987819.1 unnamed protein product [Fusarium graminearum]
MLEVESMQLLRLLEVQKVSSYAGLDDIEVQLRKKAFWLMFHGYVHQMHNLRNERLTFLDPILSCEINFEDLMPARLDDEYISTSGILACPESDIAQSLTSGFNVHSRIFLAALKSAGSDAQRHCICSHVKDPALRLTSLRERLYHLKYIFNSILPAYRPWNKSVTPIITFDAVDLANFQRDVIRANIHVTHLWLQVMLLDQIDALGSQSDDSTRPQDLVLCDEREDISRQFLDLLNSLGQPSLEPNGLSLAFIGA